jgi:aryl-alcohol dehydrogenase-like predicted oxidoreductase
MVRAAAAESLAGHPHVVDVCLAVVTREPPVDESLRLAAHGRLVAEGTAAAFSALEHDVATRELSPGARWALLGMSLAYPEDVRAGTELVFEPRARIAYVEPRRKPAVVEQRPLGKGGVLVAPLAISGAFNVPVSSLERAREAGVNTFFWEPEHRTLGEHISRAEDRRELVVIAGSYEADAQTITRDAERALRRLKIDALGAMLLFWVRSPARLSDEAFGALERLKSSGKVRAIGFSTHLRELAAEAIAARPWDVVMCRHSAAHTALETTVLPVAREKNVGVITFSALVYGRMLSPASSGVGLVRDGETERFSAADCYRYTLAQPGVSVCLSAPRRQRELEENLDVLRSPALDPDVARRLREHGARVRAENRAFMSLVREA